MTVFVQDINGNPLMPTERCGMVRHRIKEGKMSIVSYEPFTVRLTYDNGKNYVQECTLGIDSGTSHIGLSVTTEKNELFSAEAEVRTRQVKNNLKERKQNRRHRRCKNRRYRQARFNNRTHSKKAGWLPPTVGQNINTYTLLIKRVSSILPVSKIIFEAADFDTQKMCNPDISGEEYQHGQMEDHLNTREFVLWRDNYTCAICNKNAFKDKVKMHSHHIIWKTNGGSDRPDNQVCVCEKCHNKIHKNKAHLPENLNIKAKTALKLKDAGLMNSIKWQAVREIRKTFPDIPVKVTYGYKTKSVRYEHNIEKSHANDAYVISGNINAVPSDRIYLYRQNRRHNRQLQDFAPRSRRDKDGKFKMSRKERKKRGYVIKRCKEIKEIYGFTKRSLVKYNDKIFTITGLRATGNFSLRNTKDKTESYDSVSHKELKLIRKQYKSLYIENVKKR